MLRLALVFLAILVIYGLLVVVMGRDSLPYHGLSTLVRPVSETMLPPASGELKASDSVSLIPLSEWSSFQPELWEMKESGGVVNIVPNQESLWWNNIRGPLLFRYASGDVDLVASVRVRKESDASKSPDVDWQFGGIMARAPSSNAVLGVENYVFNVVGHRYKMLQVETKSTLDGRSTVNAIDWPGTDAQLALSRRGSQFRLFARVNEQAPWQLVDQFDRPDLPPLLEYGVIVYAHCEGRGNYDMQVFFDEVSLGGSQADGLLPDLVSGQSVP